GAIVKTPSIRKGRIARNYPVSLPRALLFSLALSGPAAANPTFDVRITVRSECSVQQPLFGRAAQGAPAAGICNPGTTPFQSHSIFLGHIGGTDEPPGTATQAGEPTDGGGHGMPGLHATQWRQLPVPALRSHNPYRTLIYVIF